jgi:hypothetical protein
MHNMGPVPVVIILRHSALPMSISRTNTLHLRAKFHELPLLFHSTKQSGVAERRQDKAYLGKAKATYAPPTGDFGSRPPLEAMTTY